MLTTLQHEASTAQVPLVVVLAIRSTDCDVEVQEPYKGWLERKEATQMQLQELDDRAATDLVAAVVTGGKLPDEVVQYILQHSAGVPLRLEQLARGIVGSHLGWHWHPRKFELYAKLNHG